MCWHLQRLLAHRVSQFYGLETSTVEEGEKQGRILAKRTPKTKLPLVRDPGWRCMQMFCSDQTLLRGTLLQAEQHTLLLRR